MIKPISMLFIGNSYTNRNDLPGMLERLAFAGKPRRRIVTDRVIANGMSLKTHWDRGHAAALIAKRKWNYVVLQDQSTMGLKNPTRLAEYTAKLDTVCKAHGAKTALYMTWARVDSPEQQPAISKAYEDAGRAISALVVPVGLAFAEALRIHPELVLHDKDNRHPSAAGTYLAACVFYAKLLRQLPIGLPAEGIPAEEAALLQHICAKICSAH